MEQNMLAAAGILVERVRPQLRRVPAIRATSELTTADLRQARRGASSDP